jgi:hypothetical protein
MGPWFLLARAIVVSVHGGVSRVSLAILQILTWGQVRSVPVSWLLVRDAGIAAIASAAGIPHLPTVVSSWLGVSLLREGMAGNRYIGP